MPQGYVYDPGALPPSLRPRAVDAFELAFFFLKMAMIVALFIFVLMPSLVGVSVLAHVGRNTRGSQRANEAP
jgi:hypothetical protein